MLIQSERERCATLVRGALCRFPDNPLVQSVLTGLLEDVQEKT